MQLALPVAIALPLALPLALLPGAPPPGPAPVRDGSAELRFRSREDSTVEKVFEHAVAVSLTETRIEMGGRPVPEEFLPPMEMSFESEQRSVLTDRVERARSDGAPARFRRRFDELGSTELSQMRIDGLDDADARVEIESELEGRTVVFEWDDAERAYDRRLAAGDTPSSVELGDLTEDTDFRAFLPPTADLERGDSWEVEAEHGWALIRPGGDLGLESPDPTQRAASEPSQLEGEILARLGGVREIQGRRIGVIEIEAQLRFSIETRTTLDRVPVADGIADQTLEFSYEISGELLWDVELGRFSAAELGGDTFMRIEIVKIQESDEDPAYEQVMLLEGDFTLRATARDV